MRYIKTFLSVENITLYSFVKIGLAILNYPLFIGVVPWFLNLISADFVPEKKYILAVIWGFGIATIIIVLKLKSVWEDKKVKTIKGLLLFHFSNYFIALLIICLVGGYFLRNKPNTISLFILFCLGFSADIKNIRDIINKAIS